MTDLREFFKTKALIRFKYALGGAAVDEEKLKRLIERVGDAVEFDRVRLIGKRIDGSSKWFARKRRDAKKHVQTAIEVGVRKLRKLRFTFANLVTALRAAYNALHELCRDFFKWLDDMVECTKREMFNDERELAPASG